MQTIAVDIVWQKEIEQSAENAVVLSGGNAMDLTEQKVVFWAKRWVTLFSLSTVVVFAALYYGLGAANVQSVVFQFQFVMYGAAVTLTPAVAFGATALAGSRKPTISSYGAFISILVGLICVLLPFIVAVSPWGLVTLAFLSSKLPFELTSDAVANLTPVFGLLSSTLVCLISRARSGRCR